MLDEFTYVSRNKNSFNILRLDYCSPLYSSINQASTHRSQLEENSAARYKYKYKYIKVKGRVSRICPSRNPSESPSQCLT